MARTTSRPKRNCHACLTQHETVLARPAQRRERYLNLKVIAYSIQSLEVLHEQSSPASPCVVQTLPDLIWRQCCIGQHRYPAHCCPGSCTTSGPVLDLASSNRSLVRRWFDTRNSTSSFLGLACGCWATMVQTRCQNRLTQEPQIS
jgi:hypothetical protein